MMVRSALPLCLACLVFLTTAQCFEDRYRNCTAAFYPKTACINDGTRSNYIQFEQCDPSFTRLRSAWLDVSPVTFKPRVTERNNDYPIKWQEIVIPKRLKKSGMLTVFYSKNSRFVIKAMQMKVQQCL